MPFPRLKTQPLLENHHRKSSLCCAQNPHCIDTVPLEITVVCLLSVQWEDTTAEIIRCSLLFLLQIHIQIITKKKNPNYHNLCIFHPFSHKAIYNIIQYFRKTRHFKVYENILLHQIYSGKLSPIPTAT